MTKEMMDVQALLGKSADSDFLRQMIGFAAQRPMELEVGGLTGAAYSGSVRRSGATPPPPVPPPAGAEARGPTCAPRAAIRSRCPAAIPPAD